MVILLTASAALLTIRSSPALLRAWVLTARGNWTDKKAEGEPLELNLTFRQVNSGILVLRFYFWSLCNHPPTPPLQSDTSVQKQAHFSPFWKSLCFSWSSVVFLWFFLLPSGKPTHSPSNFSSSSHPGTAWSPEAPPDVGTRLKRVEASRLPPHTRAHTLIVFH